MRVDLQVLGVLVCGLMVAGLAARRADAANAYPVAMDINQGAASFTTPWAGQFGAYTLNSSASLNGNAVLGITQNPTTALLPRHFCRGRRLEWRKRRQRQSGHVT